MTSVFQNDGVMNEFVLAATRFIVPSVVHNAFEGCDEAATRDLILRATTVVGNFVGSVAQTNGVIEHLAIADKMLNRYAWHGTTVSRSDHLELTWLLVQNLCYLFKEKLKLFFNQQKRASLLLGLPQPAWLTTELKNVEKVYGAEIRNRGNTAHNWNQKNDDLDQFFLMEALHKIDRDRCGDELRDFYFETKAVMRSRSKVYAAEGRSIFLRCMAYEPRPISLIERFNDLAEAVRQGHRLTERTA